MLYIPALVLIISLMTASILPVPFHADAFEPETYFVSEERVMMGTQVMIKALGPNKKKLDQAVQSAFEEIDRLERLMSHYIPQSQLSQINQSAGKHPVPVSRELFSIIQRSFFFSDMTEGAFDISFASVGKLWNFRKGMIPETKTVEAQLPYVNYKKIQLNEELSTVFLPYSQMEIGLGGIGKGYAMDRAIEVLEKHGIHHTMVMAGGDMVVRGKKGKEPWTVGLRDPDDQKGLLALLPIQNQAVSTSGDYERFFIKDGVRYHHILDPRTGFPVRMRCRSVTILAPDATTSDALSTSVFVLGPQQGMALIERLDGVEGIIVDSKGNVLLSSELATYGLRETGEK